MMKEPPKLSKMTLQKLQEIKEQRKQENTIQTNTNSESQSQKSTELNHQAEQNQHQNSKTITEMVVPLPLISEEKDQSSYTQVKEKDTKDTKGNTPTNRREKDYYNFFCDRFGPIIVMILMVAFGDTDKAVFYAPTPDECKELAPHAARIFTKFEDMVKLPKWAHDTITMSDSVVSLGMVVLGYLDRIGTLPQIRKYFTSSTRKANNEQSARRNTTIQVQNGTASNNRNGHGEGIDLSSLSIGSQYYEPI